MPITNAKSGGLSSPLIADLDFAQYKAIAMVCDNGATVPAAPVAGQWFLHTPTGRNILMQYNGAAWTPIISIGAMTVYVDNTDGTDAVDKGGAVDASAFKTVQYAINMIPPLFAGNVIVNINAETYNETVTIRGKSPTANYTITLQGTLTSSKAGTIGAGSVQGTGATQGTLVDNAGGMGVNAYADKLLYEGTTNAVYRIIDSNTATTFTIVGTWPTGAPVNGNAYTVYDWGTIINRINLAEQKAVVLTNLKTNGDGSYGFHLSRGSSATANNCAFAHYTFNSGGELVLDTCYLTHTGLVYVVCNNGMSAANGSKIYGSGGANSICLYITIATANLYRGSILEGGSPKAAKGAYVFGNACLWCWCDAAGGYLRIRNHTAGIYAENSGQVKDTATNQYSGNTANETAVAASYGYID